MSRTLRRIGLVLAGAIATGAILAAGARFHDGPLGPLPGGALRSGELVPSPPADWTHVRVGETVELETRPHAPWSVTTWAVVHEGGLYLPADFLNPIKRWPVFVLADPEVVLRTGGRRYPLSAGRVEDPGLIKALRQAFAAKYGITEGSASARIEVWFFRLEGR